MTDDDLRLTERQREVLALIDRRMTHKQIASEMGISPARVSQYVRAIKDRMGVETLSEIVERYRSDDAIEPYNETPSQSIKLPAGGEPDQQAAREDRGSLVFADAGHEAMLEAWPRREAGETDELKVVPGVLDGPNATTWRIGLMLSIALAVLIVLIGGLTAADTLSDLLR